MSDQDRAEGRIRPCGQADTQDMLAIINAAAEAYRGVIPPDRWHDPYMPTDELAAEMADGVVFSGYEADGRLVALMGVQRRRNVALVRHAYVLPQWQGHGIGARLLRHLCGDAERSILIGTWAAADWAIRFYERHAGGRTRGAGGLSRFGVRPRAHGSFRRHGPPLRRVRELQLGEHGATGRFSEPRRLEVGQPFGKAQRYAGLAPVVAELTQGNTSGSFVADRRSPR